MTQTRTQEATQASTQDPGFEPHDANTRAIGVAMVTGVVVIVLSIAGLFVLLGLLHRADRAGPAPTREQAAAIVPPSPNLQSHPLRDIATLRSQEDATLSAYRWVDDAHTLAQVPIGRAMALVVGRPLDPPAKGMP